MKKKYILYLFSALALCSTTSCDDWLNIDQDTEKNETSMFDNYEGFKGALAGCYADLSNTNLYGKRLSMSTLDAMAALWYIDSPDNKSAEIAENYYFRTHEYSRTAPEAAIKSIYSAFYNTILEINSVLKGCEEKRQNIDNRTSRAVVEGEAYALRALCQFDVLRLFGQIPVNPTIRVSLPYAETADLNTLPPYYPFEQYLAKLEDDLTKAESLLKDNDMIFTYNYKEFLGSESEDDEERKNYNYVKVEDDFMTSRQYRLNYWAVRALRARLYRYIGRGKEAHDIAMEVIQAKTTSGKAVVELSSMADYGVTNPKTGNVKSFTSISECLFSLYFDNLYDISVPLLRGGSDTGVDKMQVDPMDNLCLTPEWKTSLFAGANTGLDIRYLKMWPNTQTNQARVYPTIRKYYSEGGKKSGVVPIIRLSEMYLIAVEGASTLTEANSIYETYMVSKGVAVHDPFSSLDEVPVELEKEYRREFFAEGQMFYYYKRNNVKKMWSREAVNVPENEYILPLPNTEFNPDK